MKEEYLKKLVKNKYSELAKKSAQQQNPENCCGGAGCCGNPQYAVFNHNYSGLEGYFSEADLGVGCGLPTQYAGINKGDHVLDLGCGAGNDCFVASSIVGQNGKVTGLDFTDEMVEKAKANLEKTGITNIEFVKGEIENMPLPKNNYDVVISNCVLNLVPDKEKAFAEIFRVLKPGGHLCISDIVLEGVLPQNLQDAAEMYAGCVSGASQMKDYLQLIEQNHLSNIKIHAKSQITIPDIILLNYLSIEEVDSFKNSGIGIYSITITAEKLLK